MTQVAPSNSSQSQANLDSSQDIRDMMSTAKVFCRALKEGPCQREQQSIVQANQQHCPEPTWTQLALDHSIQAAADQELEDAKEEEAKELEASEKVPAKNLPPLPEHQKPMEDSDDEEEEFFSAPQEYSQVMEHEESTQKESVPTSALKPNSSPAACLLEFCKNIPTPQPLVAPWSEEKVSTTSTLPTTPAISNLSYKKSAPQDVTAETVDTAISDPASVAQKESPTCESESSEQSMTPLEATTNVVGNDDRSSIGSSMRVSFAEADNLETHVAPPMKNPYDSSSEDSDSDDEICAVMTESQVVALATPVAVLEVGTIVNVQSRTWPGMNRPGGVGRVTRAHTDGPTVAYDIQYVLGGRERQVDGVFVTPDESSTTTSPESSSGSARTSRRSRKPRDYGIPSTLLDMLAAEGFDTKGSSSGLSSSKRGKHKGDAVARGSSQPPPKRQKRARPAAKTLPSHSNKAKATSSARVPVGIGVSTSNARLEKLTDSEVLRQAEVGYQARFRQALEKGSIAIATSSVSSEDIRLLKDLVKLSKSWDVKVKLTEKLDTKTTLCLLPADRRDKHLAGCRTFKAMRSSLLGIPIVPLTWVADCSKAQTIKEPNVYFRALPSKGETSSETGVYQLAAKLPTKLLDGLKIHVCGKFSAQKRQDISTLVRDAGGEIVQHPSSVRAVEAHDLIVLCEGPAAPLSIVKNFEGSEALFVDSSWLFDSISAGQVLGPGNYEPRGQQAKALWEQILKR